MIDFVIVMLAYLFIIGVWSIPITICLIAFRAKYGHWPYPWD